MAESLLDFASVRRALPPKFSVGDIRHRVEGACIDDGSERFVGMELSWTTWRAVKVTPQGAWLKCIEWSYKKQRFALASGARWCHASKDGALDQLIARKRRHLAILESQKTMADETLNLAKSARAAIALATEAR